MSARRPNNAAIAKKLPKIEPKPGSKIETIDGSPGVRYQAMNQHQTLLKMPDGRRLILNQIKAPEPGNSMFMQQPEESQQSISQFQKGYTVSTNPMATEISVTMSTAVAAEVRASPAASQGTQQPSTLLVGSQGSTSESPEFPESPEAATSEFKAVQVMTFHDPPSLFADRKNVVSDKFSCVFDLRSVNFYLEMSFGKYEHGWLSGYLHLGGRKPVHVHECQMIVLDSSSRPLFRWELLDFVMDIGGERRGDLCSKFALSALKEFRVKVKVTYGYDVPATPDSTMPNQMLALLEDAKDADVTFHVGNENIKAHQIILSARTPYFRNMFESGMRESLSQEIDVTDTEPSVFKALLEFIYSGVSPENLNVIAKKLLPLANRYEIMTLVDTCIGAILAALSKDDVIEVLLLADLHDCEDLTEQCIPILKENMKFLKDSEDWNQLEQNPKLAVRLLKSLADTESY